MIMWLFTCVQVGVRAGIYHGAEALCDITSTRSESGSNPSWNQYLDFDLNMVDIPRMARLCLVIYGVYVTTRKTRRRAKEVKIIAQHVNQFGRDKDLNHTTAMDKAQNYYKRPFFKAWYSTRG